MVHFKKYNLITFLVNILLFTTYIEIVWVPWHRAGLGLYFLIIGFTKNNKSIAKPAATNHKPFNTSSFLASPVEEVSISNTIQGVRVRSVILCKRE